MISCLPQGAPNECSEKTSLDQLYESSGWGQTSVGESRGSARAKGVEVHLSKLRIQNFRSFENLTAWFSPGLNVIVGENNIGKTNLLDAIRAALGYASATMASTTAPTAAVNRDAFHWGPTAVTALSTARRSATTP